MSVPRLRSSPALRSGARDSLPVAVASLLIGISFGISAHAAGMPGLAAVVMSAIVFAGSAQFAAVAVLSQGGSVVAAVLAATLMNARYLAMGFALGPWLKGGPVRRAFEGQIVSDAAWAIANLGQGRFDRHRLFGSTAVQYVTWIPGTALGVLAGGVVPDPQALGIDAVFPAMFLALLAGEMRDAEAFGVAVAGAVVAVVLTITAPAGIGILAAAVVSLVGLRPRRVA
ncbi:AzlC family ABC transporter permease [Baekduia soli]|uniref:AzlC family ABC transporter permease n=1 Tax=Baekduia soli TaxID=496014 RepID=A0A5B8U7L7_9ACTN|nr:AzlC family ABC transporter permease [Baekduia soli]QEC49074.1 AzlC family ABC transporter permease [Baekduia soli]